MQPPSKHMSSSQPTDATLMRPQVPVETCKGVRGRGGPYGAARGHKGLSHIGLSSPRRPLGREALSLLCLLHFLHTYRYVLIVARAEG